ncbi:hypothetical protein BV133_1485 [Blastochloris viridis]|uniref:Uncharacterized protein n=1 Tax=Blastochloris viridis TaxID=1079 RepID=A0A182D144_BLAVI|nr:hypothetical protein BV133_1485 [Blastochloris viridis]
MGRLRISKRVAGHVVHLTLRSPGSAHRSADRDGHSRFLVYRMFSAKPGPADAENALVRGLVLPCSRRVDHSPAGARALSHSDSSRLWPAAAVRFPKIPGLTRI